MEQTTNNGPVFTEQQMERIEELTQRYQKPQSVVLEALWMWQDTHGWISLEGMKEVARVLGISEHQVYGVVTFYTMFNRAPVGRHKLEVCTNVSCMLRNGGRILQHLERRLGIKAGETTPDGRVTLVEAECLGACGTAPMMQVGDRYYENLDESTLDQILDSLP